MLTEEEPFFACLSRFSRDVTMQSGAYTSTLILWVYSETASLVELYTAIFTIQA